MHKFTKIENTSEGALQNVVFIAGGLYIQMVFRAALTTRRRMIRYIHVNMLSARTRNYHLHL